MLNILKLEKGMARGYAATVECSGCNKIYKDFLFNVSRGKNSFCSKECRKNSLNHRPPVTTKCGNCNKDVTRVYADFKNSKSGFSFCDHHCAATYSNSHKKTGNRRSKLEVFIEENIKKDFPNLEVLFNDKTIINSELDIYVPSMKLAIELNGIVHYEPIYGEDKLESIKNNDKLKTIKCYEKGIELAIIDTSSLKYMKYDNAIKFYNIVKDLITKNIKRIDPERFALSTSPL